MAPKKVLQYMKKIYLIHCYESQLSSMAKLLIANEVRIGGLGGGG